MICPACGAAGADDGAICASCGRVLDPSGRLPLGYLVAGRYELRRFLGEGGMGTVYEAYDRKLEDRVALKILKADFTHSVEMERRFRHEIKLARRLRHPNVCAIHEYGEAGPLRYIALELIEGTDLKHRLRAQGALPATEGFRIAIQIAHGLDCIHKAGVVHRDLKASNVMLDRNGEVRLMDFGIAKQLGAEATLGATAVGSIIGTPEYMSPEQGRGETIDFRSDLYSLGIVIYEIFTGDVPFRGDTPIATIFKTLQEQVDLDGPRAHGIPATLKPVLVRALAKSAADRFSNAEEMAAAIAAARDGALGPGTTILPQQTRIERPSALAQQPVPHTPTPQSWPGAPVSTTPAPWQSAPPTQVTPAPQSPPWQAPTPQPATPPPPPPPQPLPTPPPRARRAAPAAGRRSLVPLVLAVAGLVVVIVAAGTAFYLWQREASTPPSSLAAGDTGPEPTPYASLEPTPGPYDDLLIEPSPESAGSAASTPSTPEPTPLATAAAVVPTTVPAATPTPVARPTPRATPTPPPPTRPPANGQLQFYVKPWADVKIDGREAGTTPLSPIALSPGTHEVQLIHPSFEPVTLRVVVRPGRPERVEFDFSREGRRRQ